MARLLVTEEMLMESLFPGHELTLCAIQFDQPGIVELEIEGPEVPKCEMVTCHVSERKRSFKFIPSK